MTNWVEWNGGECPIKSDKTIVSVMYESGEGMCQNTRDSWRWNWEDNGCGGDIIAYLIIEDHEPMTQTREQITAQIDALQKQLDALPVAALQITEPRMLCS